MLQEYGDMLSREVQARLSQLNQAYMFLVLYGKTELIR